MARSYVFYHENTGGVFEFSFRGDDWEERLNALKDEKFPGVDPGQIDCLGIFFSTPNGILYDEELASSQGMNFTLYKFPENTSRSITEAKKYLRANRDVVSIRVIDIKNVVR